MNKAALAPHPQVRPPFEPPAQDSGPPDRGKPRAPGPDPRPR